jgi:predicted neutral ceramidase superfamily lipid hydrolase
LALADSLDRLGPPAGSRDMTHPAALRACLAISGSVLAFALLIERAGFLPSVMATVLVASVGAGTLRLRQALLLASIVAAVMAVLFVGFLHQPFTLVAGF